MLKGIGISILIIATVVAIVYADFFSEGPDSNPDVNPKEHPKKSPLVDLKKPYIYQANLDVNKKTKTDQEYEDMYRATIKMEAKEAAQLFPELAHDGLQANKWVYIFQTYRLASILDRLKNYVPDNYNGIWKTWDEKGRDYSETPYSDGKRNGLQRHYYSNGTLKLQLLYVEDAPKGLQKFFSPTGEMISLIHWNGKADYILIYNRQQGYNYKEKYKHLLKE